MKAKDNKQRNMIKWFHKLKNLGSRIFDANFNQFRRYEYNVVASENLDDLEKLKFVRNLDLAKTGFVNVGLKEHIVRLKKESRLHQRDLEITPVGKIGLHEPDGIVRTFVLGYREKDKKLHISEQKVNNCPLWNRYNHKKLIKKARHTYPLKSDFLYLKNRFFERDVQLLGASTQAELKHIFNTVLQNIYKNNTHLRQGIQHVSPQIDGKLDISNVRPIQLKEGVKGLYVPSHIGKNYVVLAPYLEAVDKGNREYLSVSEFRTLLHGKAITPFSQTKYGVDLGICGNELFVKITNGRASSDVQQWMSVDDFLHAAKIPAKMKYEVSHFLIEKKDFLVDLAQIPIPDGQSTLVIKTHYGSGAHYYALAHAHKKPNIKDFRPIAQLRLADPERYQRYRKHLALVANGSQQRNEASRQKIRL